MRSLLSSSLPTYNSVFHLSIHLPLKCHLMYVSEWVRESVWMCVCVSTINGKNIYPATIYWKSQTFIEGFIITKTTSLWYSHAINSLDTKYEGCVCVFVCVSIMGAFERISIEKTNTNTISNCIQVWKMSACVRVFVLVINVCVCFCGPLDKPSQLSSGIITDNFTAISTMPIKILFV